MIGKRTFTIALLGLLLGPAWDASAIVWAGSSQDLVDQDLRQRGGHDYTITPITDDYVINTFPGIDFFGVLFRQYPSAVKPPAGLAASNVAFVQDRQVFYLTSVTDQEDFFFSELAPVPGEDEAKDAGRAWLRLAEDLVQDGFYTFSKPAVDFSDGVVTGQVTVLNGGTGDIRVSMTFDGDGNLMDVQENRTVRPGIRPICQATKLLDADPLVRRMAEQDILVMGSAAKPYLDEQRAKAKPELKQAIDRIWKRIREEGR
jgi:hypothetical protein